MLELLCGLLELEGAGVALEQVAPHGRDARPVLAVLRLVRLPLLGLQRSPEPVLGPGVALVHLLGVVPELAVARIETLGPRRDVDGVQTKIPGVRDEGTCAPRPRGRRQCPVLVLVFVAVVAVATER